MTDDPFANIEPAPIPDGVVPGQLGGDNPSKETAEEQVAEAVPEETPEAIPNPVVEETSDTLAEQADALPAEEPEVEEDDDVPAPEPEPEPQAAEEKSESRSPSRNYLIFQEAELEGKTAFLQIDEVDAKNAEAAIRQAYKSILDEFGPVEMKLVAVAERMWRPTEVKGVQTEQVKISIG